MPLIGGALLIWLVPSLYRVEDSSGQADVLAAPRHVPTLNTAWLLRRVNAQRRRVGRQPLAADRAASLLAQQQSAEMAKVGRLFNIPDRDMRPFAFAGEAFQAQFRYKGGLDVRTPADVFAGLLKKASRREALLGRYSRVGIGITRKPPSLWVTLIFIDA